MLCARQSYPTGNISKYFGELSVGDLVDIRGPKGQMKCVQALCWKSQLSC